MRTIDWKFTQNNSDLILSDGLFLLTNKPLQTFTDVKENCFGNYLISHNAKNYYVGEGKELCKRLKQQFKPTTSTFYKNFSKLQKTNLAIKNISIDSFKVQTIVTEIGRKEIEEFGIVNLPTILNRFQIDKRMACKISQNRIWEDVQKNKNEILIQAEKEILNGKFLSWFDCNVNKNAGLYIVRDKEGRLIYIGESSDICDRHKTHSKQTYFSALRRHIGTEILEFELHEKNGRKKYFEVMEDNKVNEYLKSCKASFYSCSFGRYELEEFLIKKYKPLLNRKDNKE